MEKKIALNIARFWGELPVEVVYQVDEEGLVQDLWSDHYEDFTQELEQHLRNAGYDLFTLRDEVIRLEK